MSDGTSQTIATAIEIRHTSPGRGAGQNAAAVTESPLGRRLLLGLAFALHCWSAWLLAAVGDGTPIFEKAIRCIDDGHCCVVAVWIRGAQAKEGAP